MAALTNARNSVDLMLMRGAVTPRADCIGCNTCTFHGHWYGGNHRSGGRQEGGLGETWNRGRDFPGAGAVPGFPQCDTNWSPLLQFVRSGAGVILTSPSGPLGVGVRSGSRKRNAATSSSLAGGDARRDLGAQHSADGYCRYADGRRLLSRCYTLPPIKGGVARWVFEGRPECDGVGDRESIASRHPHPVDHPSQSQRRLSAPNGYDDP